MKQAIYEYAGFHYLIEDSRATPLPNQHPAAGKEKHRTAAVQCWEDDGCPGILSGGQYYSKQADGYLMLCNADGSRSIFDDVDQ